MNTKRHYIDLNPLINHPTALVACAWTDKGDGKTTALICAAWDSVMSCGKIATIARRVSSEMGKSWRSDVLLKLKRFRKTPDDLEWTGDEKHGFQLVDGAGKVYFFAAPLTRLAKLKSAMDYETHKNLYIDEYVILSGSYLPREVATILDIYKTIDRNHWESRILVCGNRIGKPPPLDLFFNADVNYNKNGLTTYQNGRYAVLIYSNKHNAALDRLSPFGELVEGTEFESYNSGGMLYEYTPPIYLGKLKRPVFALLNGKDVCTVFYTDTCAVCLVRGIFGAVQCYSVTPETATKSAPWFKKFDGVRQFLSNHAAKGDIFYRSKREAAQLENIAKYIYRA